MDSADDLVIRLSCPDPFRRPVGMTVAAFTDHLVEEFCAAIATHGAARIGAFIGEPIQASGGVVVPPPGYLQRMRALCRENDILFIADEVVTAFGRLGHVFASGEVFGLDPDMITFAKGVTSGYFPLGGVMMSAAVQANAGYFQTALKTLEAHDLVGEVRGMGLMACIECVADKQSRNPLALDLEVGKRIDAQCQERGLLVRPLIQMCVMSPPLVITRPQIDTMVAILDEAIRATMDDLARDGLWQG